MSDNTNALFEIGSLLASEGASREEIVQALKDATGPQPRRALTEDEYNTFAGAVGRAVEMMPAFRDAIALIRPFRDHLTPTLYTDRYSRVGIGALFFLPSLSSYRRGTLILHEAMHVLNNHFTRNVSFDIDPSSDNDAKDLEINSLLDRHARTDLSMLLLPGQEPFRFPEMQSYEQYATLMKAKGLTRKAQQDAGSDSDPSQQQDPSEGSASRGDPSSSGEPSPSESKSDPSDKKADSSESSESASSSSSEVSDQDGNQSPESIADSVLEDSDSSSETEGERSSESKPGKPGSSSCDHSTSETEQAADDLNIERASPSEQSVARSNTMVRVREEAAKSRERGDKAALMMLQKMEMAMQPSKVDWRTIFRSIMSNSRDSISMGRTHHTYRRVNKRLSSGEFIFPGMIRYEPSAIMAVDTSGSMTQKDYVRLLSELETIIKSALRAKDKFKAFCVDARATEPKPVKSLRDLDLRGGGGTSMEVAVRSIELLPKKEIPDIFVLATDGGTSWPAFKRELLKSKHSYRTVVLITEESNYEIAKTTLKGLADVVDISEEGNGIIER